MVVLRLGILAVELFFFMLHKSEFCAICDANIDSSAHCRTTYTIVKSKSPKQWAINALRSCNHLFQVLL